MANEENLIPNHERTPSELREITQKGGIASGKSRRRKKALRLALKEAVSMRLNELPEDMRTAIMSAVGITDDAKTVADAVIGGIILSACGGSAPMVRLLLDTIGESMEARMREREVRLKEKTIGGGQVDSDLNVTIIEKETRDGEHGEGD
ncbi:hypothetical protein [Selenomonas dianae]|nr:hypothetical protein [Selenomonas dianae]WLD82605.1 hypothetical protein QU667_01055 [Selenomonas dianae]